MLVHRQRLPPRMARYQLQFGIGQARVAGQPGDGLVAEGVRRAGHIRLAGVDLDQPRKSGRHCR